MASAAECLYKLTKRGALKVLHTFKGETTDGCLPLGTPTMDTKGNCTVLRKDAALSALEQFGR